MNLTPINPATGKLSEPCRVDVEQVARTVAGRGKIEQNKLLIDNKNLDSRIWSYIENIHSCQRNIVDLLRHKEELWRRYQNIQDDDKSIGQCVEHLLDSTSILAHNIEDLRTTGDGRYVFATTANLFLSPKTVKELVAVIIRKKSIGRFLIVIDWQIPQVRIANLTYRVQQNPSEANWYDHPAVHNCGVCWDTWWDIIKSLLDEHKIDVLLDTVIDFLLASTHESHPYLQWSKWLNEKKTITNLVKKGASTLMLDRLGVDNKSLNYSDLIDKIIIPTSSVAKKSFMLSKEMKKIFANPILSIPGHE